MNAKSGLFLGALLLSAPATKLNAQSASNAASFLEIDGGARGAAMGGAFTAIADDASSVFYNPAGPALAGKREIMLSHSQWLEGLWNEHLAYLHPVSDRLTIFTGVSGLLGPPLDKYDINGEPIGTFTAFDGAFGVGAALSLSKNSYAGINLKAIYSQADKEKAYAYAGDIGIIHNYNRLRLGFAVQNIGTQMKLYQRSFDLPLISRGGAAYRLMNKYWLSVDGIKIGEGDTFLAGGAEGEFGLTPEYTGFARLGYKEGRSKNTGSGLAAGVGVKSGDLSGDYAFSPFGELGDTHRLTLGLKFGKDRGELSREKDERSDYRDTKPERAREPEPGVQAIEPELPDAEAVEIVTPEPIAKKAYPDYLEAADGYLAQKDYRSAAKEYNKAQKALSKNDRRRIFTYEQQGQVSVKLKNLPKAKEFYLAAIQTAKRLRVSDTTVVNAYLGLAYCFEKSGNLAPAIKNYEKALGLSTNEATRIRIRKSLQKLKSQFR